MQRSWRWDDRPARSTYEWLAEREERSKGRDARLGSGLALYNLQMLGHVEVDWAEQRWAVAPSTMVWLEGAGGNAALAGSRPRWLLDRLRNLDSDADPELAELAIRICPYDAVAQPRYDGPPALYFTAPEPRLLERVCERIGIAFEPGVQWATALLPKLRRVPRDDCEHTTRVHRSPVRSTLDQSLVAGGRRRS